MLDLFEKGVGFANTWLSYALVILLAIAGVWFTLRLKGVQIRLIGEQFRSIKEKPMNGKGMSSFQALMVSTASRVGTGNIIGVSLALFVGGFGAVFWMWVMAIIGAASAFVESTLAQIFKKRGKNGCYGGPAYYIEATLHCRPLAIAFSVILILTYGFGFNMLASYNLQKTFSSYSFYNKLTVGEFPWAALLIGLVVAILVGYCLFGGGRRIAQVTGVMVPVMGAIYILVALVIVILNIGALPSVFGKIFSNAFDFKAIFGGFSGSCIMYGIKRGVFSNEAGVGSAPNASASAEVAHPVKQGLVQVLSVFLDTLLVCSATAFMCMCSGVDPASVADETAYVQASLSATLGDFGPIFLTVAMILFAFTTLLGNLYYVEQCLAHICKGTPSKSVRYTSYVISCLVIVLGAVLSSSLLWGIADVTMAGMALINIPVILFLGRYAFRALKDYEKQRKEGKDPVFYAQSIDLPYDTDYWK
ncbi:MAG: alanine:cation symporter family protein [Clostridia bacterium]|nr:alanine:cation symporter family protein [Clostridia bacterium]